MENPQYRKRPAQTYLFEEQQVLQLDVYDEMKDASPKLTDYNLVVSSST